MRQALSIFRHLWEYRSTIDLLDNIVPAEKTQEQISIAPPSLLASPLELSNTINESIRTKNNNSIFDSIFDELGIPQNTDPLKWWAEKKNEFPLMSELALKYLCVSATSVPSERLFSDIGNQITKKRNNLSTDSVSSREKMGVLAQW
ncbi:4706_t:CDS:2 [Entrophospora sp. SA101]|nr:4706_t:CDS:2 [Entrophospora sp. SA101]